MSHKIIMKPSPKRKKYDCVVEARLGWVDLVVVVVAVVVVVDDMFSLGILLDGVIVRFSQAFFSAFLTNPALQLQVQEALRPHVPP